MEEEKFLERGKKHEDIIELIVLSENHNVSAMQDQDFQRSVKI